MKRPGKTALIALSEAARSASEKAIAPWSGFSVGAALLTAAGKVYTGCNVENPSLTLVVCAERVALFKALSEGEREFSAIAVYASEKEYCPPCGSCRQMLFEFAPDLIVVMAGKKDFKTKKISELLPEGFKV